MLGVVVLRDGRTGSREVGEGEGASLTLGKRWVPAARQQQFTRLLNSQEGVALCACISE